MTYAEVAEMIGAMAEAVGGPFTYYQWPPERPEDVPEPPYILFWYPERDDFAADNENYQIIPVLRIELYTETKDFAAEAALEQVLRDREFTYDVSEEYLDAERMHMTVYETEVMIHAQ